MRRADAGFFYLNTLGAVVGVIAALAVLGALIAFANLAGIL
jgi:hypothetical protein